MSARLHQPAWALWPRIARFALLTALLALIPAARAGAAPVGGISEFSNGIALGATPFMIAPGPDGNLWFTTSGTASIGRITPQGQITSFTAGLQPGDETEEIAGGADGNVWFTVDRFGSSGAIGRITPQGQITEFSNGLGQFSNPVAIAPGPGGNMWFTASQAVGFITPQGQITEYKLSGSRPTEITAGADGNMWFNDQASPPAIGRITPQGVVTEFTQGLPSNAALLALVSGPDGSLWFTDNSNSHPAIGRVTLAGQITEFTDGLTNSAPFWLTVAPDGNLWFTDVINSMTPAIGRMTRFGQITLLQESTNIVAETIVAGADGNLWFTDSATNQIGRLGVGAPPAVEAPPVLAGSGRIGAQQTCANGLWNDFAFAQPSGSAYPFDGVQWLRDGIPIAGQTGPTYVPGAGDAGHQLSCTTTATYTLLGVTASATSQAVAVSAAPSGPAGSPGSAGPAGARGPGGEVQLVSCTSITRTIRVRGRNRKVTQKKCTSKLLTTAPKITLAASDHATLARRRRTYATGTVAGGRLLLHAIRPIRPGRYELTIKGGPGSAVLARSEVVIG